MNDGRYRYVRALKLYMPVHVLICKANAHDPVTQDGVEAPTELEPPPGEHHSAVVIIIMTLCIFTASREPQIQQRVIERTLWIFPGDFRFEICERTSVGGKVPHLSLIHI